MLLSLCTLRRNGHDIWSWIPTEFKDRCVKFVFLRNRDDVLDTFKSPINGWDMKETLDLDGWFDRRIFFSKTEAITSFPPSYYRPKTIPPIDSYLDKETQLANQKKYYRVRQVIVMVERYRSKQEAEDRSDEFNQVCNAPDVRYEVILEDPE